MNTELDVPFKYKLRVSSASESILHTFRERYVADRSIKKEGDRRRQFLTNGDVKHGEKRNQNNA